jgi:hypothetical protein
MLIWSSGRELEARTQRGSNMPPPRRGSKRESNIPLRKPVPKRGLNIPLPKLVSKRGLNVPPRERELNLDMGVVLKPRLDPPRERFSKRSSKRSERGSNVPLREGELNVDMGVVLKPIVDMGMVPKPIVDMGVVLKPIMDPPRKPGVDMGRTAGRPPPRNDRA